MIENINIIDTSYIFSCKETKKESEVGADSKSWNKTEVKL